jgi:hypothetical protein
MSEPSSKPAPLVSVIALYGILSLFLVVVAIAFVPHASTPFVGDGIHTTEQRQQNLADLRAKQAKQAASYGWVDQKTGVVQLPIDRAMELTVERYAKKP